MVGPAQLTQATTKGLSCSCSNCWIVEIKSIFNSNYTCSYSTVCLFVCPTKHKPLSKPSPVISHICFSRPVSPLIKASPTISLIALSVCLSSPTQAIVKALSCHLQGLGCREGREKWGGNILDYILLVVPYTS